MTVEEIIALCHAGYNSDQIMQLAQAQQMERAQQMQKPQQMPQTQQPVQPQQPVQQPVQQPTQQQPAQPSGYEQIMSELLGLKQAVQAGNMMKAQQPMQIMSADDIIANIIAPKPKKED